MLLKLNRKGCSCDLFGLIVLHEIEEEFSSTLS